MKDKDYEFEKLVASM